VLWFTFYTLLLLFLVSQFVKFTKGTTLALAIAITLALSLLAGGRTDYGVDYDEYVAIFEATPQLQDFFSIGALAGIHGEVVFLLMCSVAKSIGMGYEQFFLLFSLLTVSITIHAYRKLGWGISAAVLLYFSHNFLLKEMGQIRNGMSSAVLLLALYSLQHRRYKAYLVYVLIASAIHQAAIIFLLARFIINRNFLFVFLLLILAFAFGAIGWLQIAMNIFGQIFTGRLAMYTNTEYFNNIGLYNPQTVKQLIFSLLFYLYLNEMIKSRSVIGDYSIKLFSNALKIYLMSVLFLFVFVEFDLIARRLASYFAILEPVIFAHMLYLTKKTKLKNLYFSLIIFIVLYASVSTFANLNFRDGFNVTYKNWMVYDSK
jgi:hypothetical protein